MEEFEAGSYDSKAEYGFRGLDWPLRFYGPKLFICPKKSSNKLIVAISLNTARKANILINGVLRPQENVCRPGLPTGLSTFLIAYLSTYIPHFEVF